MKRNHTKINSIQKQLPAISEAQQKYVKKIHKYHSLILCAQILLLFILIIFWEIAARIGWIDSFIFSSPTRIAKCFIKMVSDGSIFRHISITMGETFISFALIVILGIGVALILWLYTPLSHVLEPYLVVLNSLPKSALAPMLIVWLGNSPKAIIVTAISVALFGTILNIYTSFMETDPELLKLMNTFGATKRQTLFKLILPSSLNTIISNMKVNIGLCLVGVIIGEFLAARQGLGYLIIYNSQIFCMDVIAMAIIILCIISIILFKIVDIINKLIRIE